MEIYLHITYLPINVYSTVATDMRETDVDQLDFIGLDLRPSFSALSHVRLILFIPGSPLKATKGV